MREVSSMKGYWYEWTNITNKKWYVGSTNGKNDGYVASGSELLADMPPENKRILKLGEWDDTNIRIDSLEDLNGNVLFVRECHGVMFYRKAERDVLQERNAAADKMSYNQQNEYSEEEYLDHCNTVCFKYVKANRAKTKLSGKLEERFVKLEERFESLLDEIERRIV